jgi:demethylmenaquinone methyltransferase/2-methoxy-6-polyprenyl-1,4-benzoquinol methylase
MRRAATASETPATDAIEPVKTSKAQSRAWYSRIAPLYDFTEGVFEAATRRRAIRLAGVRPGESVLEIGCGTGWALQRLGRRCQPGGIVAGLDISRSMLAITSGRLRGFPRWLLAEGDGAALPFADGVFDVVFMSYVLELFATEEIPAVLTEVDRVLQHGTGRLVNLSLSRERPNLLTRVYEWGHRQMPTAVDCRPIYGRRSAKAAGFSVERTVRDSIWGLPVEIVLARPDASAAE